MGAMEGYSSPPRTVWALKCALILLMLLPTSSQDYLIYQICSPVQLSCGENEISNVVAPFRTEDQPESCGRKSFRLFCHGKYPAIQINSSIYWVKEIYYQARILTLVNIDLVGAVCPSTLTTSSLDISPFAFSMVREVVIYYNCLCPSKASGVCALTCPPNVTGSYSYLATESASAIPYQGCRCDGAVVHVALSESEFKNLTKSSSIDPVRFTEALKQGFHVVWPDPYPGSDWCKACNESGGKCKYDVTWGAGKSCLCQGGTYASVCPHPGAGRWETLHKKAIIGTCLGGFFLSSCLLLYLCRHFYHLKMVDGNQDIQARRRLKQSKYIEAFLRKYGSLAPKSYSYSELEKMTNSFSDEIGKGGFATVFKGKLLDGHLVAVKVLSNSKGFGKEFVNEVLSIGWTYHLNVVSLLGYCSEGSRRALIYEFMPNGSLERFIFGDKRGTLGLEKLYDVAVGVARGLEYLHGGCGMSILHFDIKPHNILLDQDFCPKISDFGLAKLCGVEDCDVIMRGARGTAGYIAPEVMNRGYGSVSSKSDVYSYGMMVLEMVGRRKNVAPHADHTSEIYYPHWMYRHLDADGNFKACGATTEEEEVISRRMIMVGLWCIQTYPAERPSINRVVAMLEGRIKDLHMPPLPLLFSPPRASELSITSS